MFENWNRKFNKYNFSFPNQKFVFIQLASCIYLFHNKTQKSLGLEPRKTGIGFDHPAPVSGVKNAIDFKMEVPKS